MPIWIDVSPWLARPRPPVDSILRLAEAGLPQVEFCAVDGGTAYRLPPARLRELLAATERESVASRLVRRLTQRRLSHGGEPVHLGERDVVLRGQRGHEHRLIRQAVTAAFRGTSAFEDRLEHFYQALLGPGDVAIDIGAHSGRHTLPLAVAVHAAGKVFAFEPNPPVAALLEKRVTGLDFDQVTMFSKALSDESGVAEFVVAVDLPEESGLRERTYNGPTRTERIQVELARLDDLGLPRSRFIKLDTEGAELKVLRGARTSIDNAQPVVAFEFGEASYKAYDVDPYEVFDYFDTLGYDIFSILGEALARDAFAQASRVQQFWDYVACPRRESARVQGILLSFTET